MFSIILKRKYYDKNVDFDLINFIFRFDSRPLVFETVLAAAGRLPGCVPQNERVSTKQTSR